LKGSGNGQALLKPVPAVSSARPVPWSFLGVFHRPLKPDSCLRPSGSAHRCRPLRRTAMRLAWISH